MMFRQVNYVVLRRFIRYTRFYHNNRKGLTRISRNLLIGTTQLTFLHPVPVSSTENSYNDTLKGKMDIDKIQQALLEGGEAIIQLMDELKDVVKVTCEEYRKCLFKQIEITERTKNLGPLSECWDELPQYRTLADELLQDLNNYKALFETLGKMTESAAIGGIQEFTSTIKLKYQEFQKIFIKEFEENKKLEMKLLKLNCDTILNDLLKGSRDN